MKTKICTKCGIKKEISEFHKLKNGKFGVHSTCKSCRNQYMKDYQKENKEQIKKYMKEHRSERNHNKKIWDKEHLTERRMYKEKNREKSKNQYLIKTYGITLEQYNQMLIEQNGVCAICGQKETRKSKYNKYTLSVDHNHKTGKVRGLLCHGCNNCLGTLKDDIKIFQSAIEYLNKN
jgi:hypothetical protein